MCTWTDTFTNIPINLNRAIWVYRNCAVWAGLISEAEKLQPDNIQHTRMVLDTRNMQISGVTLIRRLDLCLVF